MLHKILQVLPTLMCLNRLVSDHITVNYGLLFFIFKIFSLHPPSQTGKILLDKEMYLFYTNVTCAFLETSDTSGLPFKK